MKVRVTMIHNKDYDGVLAAAYMAASISEEWPNEKTEFEFRFFPGTMEEPISPAAHDSLSMGTHFTFFMGLKPTQENLAYMKTRPTQTMVIDYHPWMPEQHEVIMDSQNISAVINTGREIIFAGSIKHDDNFDRIPMSACGIVARLASVKTATQSLVNCTPINQALMAMVSDHHTGRYMMSGSELLTRNLINELHLEENPDYDEVVRFFQQMDADKYHRLCGV